MRNDTHDWEIERVAAGETVLGQAKHRVSCSCGFLGPWRAKRRTARADGEAHDDRRAAGEA